MFDFLVSVLIKIWDYVCNIGCNDERIKSADLETLGAKFVFKEVKKKSIDGEILYKISFQKKGIKQRY